MSGGYDYTFVYTVPSRLICKTCDLPCRNAYLSECCGSNFCKTCLDNVKKSKSLSGQVCPSCRNKTFNTFQNKQADREVSSLQVFCTNRYDGGCEWKGAVSDIEMHKRSCSLEMVHCDYHGIGCDEKIRRKNLNEHNKTNMENHLTLCVTKLKNLEQLVFQLTVGDFKDNSSERFSDNNWAMKLRCLSMMTSTSDDHLCPVILEMSDFSTKKKDESCWSSNCFYTHNKGYKMCLYVYVNGTGDGKGTHMSTYMQLMRGPYDDDLSWPLRGKFEMKLLNQINDIEHYSQNVSYDHEATDDVADRVTKGEEALGWGKAKYISNNDLYKTTALCQYLKNDQVFFQIKFNFI